MTTFFILILFIIIILMMLYLNIQVNEFESKYLDLKKIINDRFQDSNPLSEATKSNPEETKP